MGNVIRVLQIVPNMQAGGLETLIMNIYRNIDRSKVQFDFLVHYTSKYFYDDEIEKLGGKIYRLSFREDNNLSKYIKDLNMFFSMHKYKIVHCHMASTALFTLGIAKKHGVNIRILHSHNSNTDSTLKGRIKRILLKSSKQFANKYFACGIAAGKFLYKENKFEVIHNAIDIKKFAFAERKNDSVLNILKERYVIGHIGRFTEQKNHRFLIEVFDDYHKKNINSVLLLVGEGELENEIKDMVIKLGLEDCVIFYEVSQNVQSIYKCMDIFLLPSLFEGLPVVGIETQAAGVKSLCSENITDEIGITNLVEFLPIDQGTELWVKALERNCNANEKFNIKENNLKLLEEAGYEIKSEAVRIQKIYEDLYIED